MDLTRRSFIKIGFAFASAAALAGCGRPVEHDLVSQYGMPEYQLPGEPLFYATTCGDCSSGCGVAVRVMHGRANHVMGIPSHPVNRGKVCARGLSAVQALYHPDRLTAALKKAGQAQAPADPKEAMAALAGAVKGGRPSLWIVPRLSGASGAFLARLAASGGGRVWVLDVEGEAAQRMAVKALTGRAELPHEDFAAADYVLNLGGDPLGGPNQVEAGVRFGQLRESRPPKKSRGLLVTFSTRMNRTAANSDKWVPVRPGGEAWVALGLTKALEARSRGTAPAWASELSLKVCAEQAGIQEDVFDRLAARLLEAEAPLVIGGGESAAGEQAASTLRLILGLNRALGRQLQTRETSLLVGEAPAGVVISGREALDGLKAGRFANVMIHDVDPAYLLPEALGFAEAIGKAGQRFALASFRDRTTELCDWVIPTATWLESWGDSMVESPVGKVYGLQQPVVVPREGSQGFLEVLMAAAREAGLAGVPASPQALLQGSMDGMQWEDALSRGGLWPTASLAWDPYPEHPLTPPPALPNPGPAPSASNPWSALKAAGDAPLIPFEEAGTQRMALVPFASTAVGDGRFSNRPWLLEFPDPLTTIPWSNWAELNPQKAQELAVANGDMITLKSEVGDVTLPVFITPGIHPEAVGVPLGWGRSTPGHWSEVGWSLGQVLEPRWQEGSGEVAWGATRVVVTRASGQKRLTILDQRVNGLPRRVLPH